MARPRDHGVTPYTSGGYWNMRKWVDGKLITAKVKDPDGSDKGRAEVRRRFEANLAAHVEAQIEAAKAAAVAAVLPARPTGRYTVHEWVRYYVKEIVEPNRAYNTWRDYVHVTESMIIPNIADVPLPELEAEHIDKMVASLRLTGSEDKPYRAYDRLRTMLNAAVKRQKSTGLTHNPCHGAATPERPKYDIDPPTKAEVKRILLAAQELPRNAARWTVALALGIRQGEALALTWDAVDLDRELMWVRANTYRRKWLHGCDDPHACGEPYHRYPCPGNGAKHNRYHRDGCPKVARYCSPDCTEHAAQCPQGHGGVDAKGQILPGGRVTKDPKSDAGKRVIKLPKPLVAELRRHKAAQDRERLAAGDRWQQPLKRRSSANRAPQGNLVFATRYGTEINERDDWGEFVDLVAKAEVVPKQGKNTRPHDGRHFAATMMLLLKIDPAVVMDQMGWSSRTMLKRYQHVIDEMRAEAAEAVAGALWDEAPEDSATPGATAMITDLGEERRKRR